MVGMDIRIRVQRDEVITPFIALHATTACYSANSINGMQINAISLPDKRRDHGNFENRAALPPQ